MHTYPIILHLSIITYICATGVIDRRVGFGTYYSNIEQKQAYGRDFTMQNQGPIECNKGALTLNDIDFNLIVAINHTLLSGNLAKSCGRQVNVIASGI